VDKLYLQLYSVVEKFDISCGLYVVLSCVACGVYVYVDVIGWS